MDSPANLAVRLQSARLELGGLADGGSLDRLLRRALDIGEEITGSKIGFFHFVDDNQESLTLQAWSSNTLQRMCTAEGKGKHYPVTQAGVWVDCFRARKPVVHNDYATLPYRKGLPPGHAPVLRELTVPILRDGKVVAIAGVGNKPGVYTDADVQAFEALASLVIDLVLRMRPGGSATAAQRPAGGR